MDYAIKTLSQLKPILQGFRKAAGLTQAAMAAHLGVTQQTYAQLEANPAAVSVERLFKVLRVLQVDLKLSQSGAAQGVAMEDTAPPPNLSRVSQKPETSAQKQRRAQGSAQRAATTSTREATGNATAKAAKAARSAPAAPKPKTVKLAKATKAASAGKKREDW